MDDYIAVARKVARMVSRKYTFAYFDADDIEQQALLFALEAQPRYDPNIAPPKAFIFKHVINRLRGLYRNKYWRSEPACPQCANGYFCGSRAEGEGVIPPEPGPCDRHLQWLKTNTDKSNIASPADFDTYPDLLEDALLVDYPNELEENELSSIIDKFLPSSLRPDYLRMLSGVAVRSKRKLVIQNAIRAIIKKHAPKYEGGVN